MANRHRVLAVVLQFLPQPGRPEKNRPAALWSEVLMELQSGQIDLKLFGKRFEEFRSVVPGHAKVFFQASLGPELVGSLTPEFAEELPNPIRESPAHW